MKAQCIRVGSTSINLSNIAFFNARKGTNKHDGRDVYLLVVHFTKGVAIELEGDTPEAVEDLRIFIEDAMNGKIGGDTSEHVYTG